ncbi:hypothetical protein Tco_0941347 [Tanacetum coccineum]|uniref:Uncharacterized protein n=1 Tax=Tanacetum coccineum TaxID=301880 RepID=A0ABQ5DRB7_9ASTR
MLVSRMSKQQDCTAMSSAEAEYVALSGSCDFTQGMGMRTQLQVYGFNYNTITVVLRFSVAILPISCNPCITPYQHIHNRITSLKEQVGNGIIDLYFDRTEYPIAELEVLTKESA